ncbi:hypothetical protein NKG05_02615 [Oerskovia sp. M15]
MQDRMKGWAREQEPLVGAWSRRSNPERFDAYTRWSLYVLSSFELFVVLWIAGPRPRATPPCSPAARALPRAHRGLHRRDAVWHRPLPGRPAPPRWAVGAMIVLAVVTAAVGLAAYPTGEGSMFEGNVPVLVATATAAFSVAACAPLLTFRWLAASAVGVAAVSGSSPGSSPRSTTRRRPGRRWARASRSS